MFGLLNTTQIYGIQTTNEPSANHSSISSRSSKSSNNTLHQRPRSTSSLSDSVRDSKLFSSLSSMHAGIKSPTNFIEKFLKNELLNSYDSLKNYKNIQHSSPHPRPNPHPPSRSTEGTTNKSISSNRNSYSEGILNNFNCLQGSYRSNSDGEFYEAVNVLENTQKVAATSQMTIKCSKNLLAEPAQVQAPATLQNYQKLPDYEQHGFLATPEVLQLPSSGASSGEFNGELTTGTSAVTTASSNSFYKRLPFGGNRSGNSGSKHLDVGSQSQQANEIASDNSSSSITTTTTTNSSTSTTTTKSNDLHRSSSASSSGDCVATARERKCKSLNLDKDLTPTNSGGNGNGNSSGSNNIMAPTTERAQRRKLIQMISNYEQQNKLLQRELMKEKRRRTEELSRVVKSLICFESKLKTDMKAVNQRLADKDIEICRLVRQNRALRKRVAEVQRREKEKICDEGVVVGDGDGEADDANSDKDEQEQSMEDCLVLEALQCNNCRKQFYDIELKEGCTQTMGKDGRWQNADHNVEHGSSSDDTLSSSFCGARRSVRYTSKRTSGTFRDYMRSRCLNIDDPSLEQNSEENTSTVSRDDSQTSYEKLNVYSRTIERMHGVKCESEHESSEQSGVEIRPSSKASRTSSRCSSKSSEKSTSVEPALEEDDGIFSPTQDDDFDEEQNSDPATAKSRTLKIVPRRPPEFSEASPKQIYETSTDDWYASASDQEEIVGGRSAVVTVKNSYGQGAVNPVLECVNQILLQQSMDEAVTLRERPNEKASKNQRPQNLNLTPSSLPRRSSLSGRRHPRGAENGDPSSARSGTLTRKRVHFSTKNSMVHVPRNDEVDEEDEDEENVKEHEMKLISPPFHTMRGFPTPTTVSNVIATEASVETFNYESIYSNEYEPVGSERNSSNLYVDMEAASKLLDPRPAKKPPALPPKPANLIKFKKSLQQLDEMPDEQQDCEAEAASMAASEPDYCSISEVNVGITNVQIVAVVHKPPTSVAADDELEAPVSELDLEVSTVASDETCGAISQKTDEIEEIFADIPKLPNVAAIIAPKKQIKQKLLEEQANDYLIMSPKVETPNGKAQNARRMALNLNVASTSLPHELLGTPMKSPKVETSPFPLNISLGATTTPQHLQYKRKAMPNILAEINQRLSLPCTPTTSPTATVNTPKSTTINKMKHTPINTPKKPIEETMDTSNIAADLPLQAEFDWYNLDAEYGRSTSASTAGSTMNQPDLLKVNDHHNCNGMLAEISEDHESVTTTADADEYNLDEEFSLTSDQQQQPDVLCAPTPDLPEPEELETHDDEEAIITQEEAKPTPLDNAVICEGLNFPLYNESSPAVAAPAGAAGAASAPAKTKKMKNNLANFEKFIEGSGLSTKPLPSKRKIYFAGPYV